jgi:hypothetical protein
MRRGRLWIWGSEFAQEEVIKFLGFERNGA